tara:strand:+ start:90 stop:599 length:510 start_codon:yes stop_codon:yes gene_type:complete
MDFLKQPTISPILPPKSNDWGWKYICPRDNEKDRLEIRNYEIDEEIDKLEKERYRNIFRCRTLEIELKKKNLEIKLKLLLKKLYKPKLEKLKKEWLDLKEVVVGLSKQKYETKSSEWPELESRQVDYIEAMTYVLEPQIEKIVHKTEIDVSDWFVSSKAIDDILFRKKK